MVWAKWLADAARSTGYPVVEVSGWETRGSGGGRALNAVEGVVLHHTAGAARGDYPSYNVVKNGRAGLSGPLSQIGLGRSGTIYVFAAGRSNHAGTSNWAGFSNLNGYFIGIEAESVGDGKDWTPEQVDAYPRLVAAILHYIRRNGNRAAGHREVGIPKGRKIDPAGFNMGTVRDQVDDYLKNPSTIKKGSQVVQVDVELPNSTKEVQRRVIKYVSGQSQMQGEDVAVALQWAGIASATSKSYYGPNSAKAVAAKQKSVGLEADGVVGPNTWSRILKDTITRKVEKNEVFLFGHNKSKQQYLFSNGKVASVPSGDVYRELKSKGVLDLGEVSDELREFLAKSFV